MTTHDFEPVRLGLIGCGGMGIRHALAVMDMKSLGCRPVQITAICDANADRREQLAAMLAADYDIHPAIYADAAELMDSPEVEAVDIVLPTSLHHTMVLDAIAAGKHVLVEKPMALTVAACDLIVAAADRSNLVVAVGENYRRIASNRAMAKLIRSGELGQLDAMFVRNIASTAPEMTVAGRQIVPPAWYHDRSRAGGYHSLEMAVHEADLQRFWFGEIDTVLGETHVFGPQSRRNQNADEDMLSATLTFESGFVSHLSFCSAMQGVDIADRLIVGQESFAQSGAWHAWQNGLIRKEDGSEHSLEGMTAAYVAGLTDEERLRLLPPGAWNEEGFISSSVRPLTYGVGLSIHDFARAVRAGEQPEITPEVARLAVATCYAIKESAQLRAPVRVADVLSGEIAGAQLPLNRAIGLA